MLFRTSNILYKMSGYIFKYIASASLTDTNDTAVAMPSFTTSARRITMDITNSRYFVSVGNTVQVYSLSHALSSTITQVGGSFNTPHGMCVDAANNRLLVCNQGNNTISVINLTTLALTSVVTLASGFMVAPQGIDFDANYYYVANGSTEPAITLINRTTLVFEKRLLQGTLGNVGTVNDVKVSGNKIFYASASGGYVGVLDTITNATLTRIAIPNFSLLINIDDVNNRFVIWNQGELQFYYYNLQSLRFIKSVGWLATWGGVNTDYTGMATDTVNKRMLFVNKTALRLEVVNYI